jgi:hypothetical protein
MGSSSTERQLVARAKPPARSPSSPNGRAARSSDRLSPDSSIPGDPLTKRGRRALGDRAGESVDPIGGGAGHQAVGVVADAGVDLFVLLRNFV